MEGGESNDINKRWLVRQHGKFARKEYHSKFNLHKPPFQELSYLTLAIPESSALEHEMVIILGY